jgi:hypothetical protein
MELSFAVGSEPLIFLIFLISLMSEPGFGEINEMDRIFVCNLDFLDCRIDGISLSCFILNC